MGDEKDKTQHLITVRDLHDKPMRIRYWLSHGHELVLTYRGKVRGYIRPYDAERDEPFNGPSIKDVAERGSAAAEGKRVFMTFDDIRSNMDAFIFGLEDGHEFVVGHYFNKLGIATEKVPEDVSKALKADIVAGENRMKKAAEKAWETKRSGGRGSQA
jgi:hypothetical protein